MLLVIDTGNTNTVFAVHDGDSWRAQWRMSTDPTRTGDEYVIWLNQSMGMQGLDLADVDACVISTVVPQSLFQLRNLCRRHLSVEPLVVGEGIDIGVRVAINEPGVGADRLVNALGATVAHEGDLLVVDSGTATTFDVISGEPAFLGGVIAPGINLSMQALHEAAAALPRIAIQPPAHTIGRTTVEAMQSGVYWGYICLIEGMVERIRAEHGKPLTVVATGGVASLFHGATDKIDQFDPELTIRGLLEISKTNPPKSLGQ